MKMADKKDQKQTKPEALTGSMDSAVSAAPAKDIDEAMQRMRRQDIEKAVEAQAKSLKLPYVDIAHTPINPELLELIDLETIEKAAIIPFFRVGKKVQVAVHDPKAAETKKVLEKLTANGWQPQISLASREGILQSKQLYQNAVFKPKKEESLTVEEKEIETFQKEIENIAQMKAKIENVSSEEALNIINVGATKTHASDVHFQPEEKSVIVRFRIDGVLQKVLELNSETYADMATQIKHKSGLKLNITDVPQDGRYSFKINNRKIDVRVSSIPVEFGESIVCRYLDAGKHMLDLEEMGFHGKALEKLVSATHARDGMILVTGPTGSGKTTTLYGLLKRFNTSGVKIITLENPIEYNLSNITQSQINERDGYTFAKGLKAVLRQDPDIVMIGEIRDLETAETAVQAALTGHVLLATLHTNSAVETVPRLLNMGLEPFMIAPALHTIIAQRLVRKVCVCAEHKPITEAEKSAINPNLEEANKIGATETVKMPSEIAHPKGCDTCSHTGYKGQTVIAEIITATDDFKEAILQGKSTRGLLEIARAQGMLMLKEDAMIKVAKGETTLEEVERVTGMSADELEDEPGKEDLEIVQTPAVQVGKEVPRPEKPIGRLPE